MCSVLQTLRPTRPLPVSNPRLVGEVWRARDAERVPDHRRPPAQRRPLARDPHREGKRQRAPAGPRHLPHRAHGKFLSCTPFLPRKPFQKSCFWKESMYFELLKLRNSCFKMMIFFIMPKSQPFFLRLSRILR